MLLGGLLLLLLLGGLGFWVMIRFGVQVMVEIRLGTLPAEVDDPVLQEDLVGKRS